MAEETKTTTLEEDYIEQIAQLKNKLDNDTVSLDEYNKVRADNKRLIENYINGVREKEAEEVPEESIEDLAKDIKSGTLNNLDYWTKSLKYRDSYKEMYGVDPWLPAGRDYQYNASDAASADYLYETVKECIDNCDGNSAVFSTLLEGRIQKSIKR